MEMYYRVIVYILAGLIGLCVGSFLNVVIYRVPRSMSLAKPNSHCPNCQYSLRWYDNVPVFSYLLLRGKCRKCRARISPRYVAVELVNAILWELCFFAWGDKSLVLSLLYAFVFSTFLCIFFIDLEHSLIFDRFQVILLVLGAASIFFDPDYGWLSHVIGGVVGFVFFFLVSFLFEKLCGREGLGGGDVKFAGAAGVLLGWERLIFALLIATISAAIIMSIAKRGKEGEEKQFPFAPFLIVGFGISMFFGTQVIGWYLSLLGL